MTALDLLLPVLESLLTYVVVIATALLGFSLLREIGSK